MISLPLPLCMASRGQLLPNSSTTSTSDPTYVRTCVMRGEGEGEGEGEGRGERGGEGRGRGGGGGGRG